jgi:patatin-like phospholipase/acyl hydrolase
MKDIGRATTAAPTFFPAAYIKSMTGKQYSLIDGGLGINNPSKLVLDEVSFDAKNDGNPDNFFLLSLSTGMPQQSSGLKKDAGFGQIGNIIATYGISS